MSLDLIIDNLVHTKSSSLGGNFIFMKWIVFFINVSLPFFSFGKPLFILGNEVQEVIIRHSDQFELNKESKRKENKDRIDVRAEKGSLIQVGWPSGKIHIVLQRVQKIKIENLKDVDLSISVKKGSVFIDKSKGNFKITVDKGQVHFKNSSGDFLSHLYSASLFVSKFNGSLKVLSYSSPVSIEHSNGQFNIQSYSSALNLDHLKGRLQFRVEKSLVHLKLFKGDVYGYSDTGMVKGSFTPGDVEIETGSGMIRLYFQSSHARVRAQSWEGKVYAPKNFYKDRAGGIYKARGVIKGRGDVLGRVSLKSQSGKIYIL